jgi:hypothetical protein
MGHSRSSHTSPIGGTIECDPMLSWESAKRLFSEPVFRCAQLPGLPDIQTRDDQ